jgi:hypothetical protein
MDGLGSRHTDLFLAQCTECAVDVLFLVPDTSDETQSLDLWTFSVNLQSNQVVLVLAA